MDTTIPNHLAPNGWPKPLLDGFRRGDRQAMSEIYRRHGDAIAGLLRHGFAFSASGRSRRFVGFQSAFELQDALHETFRLAFEPAARARYDGLRDYGPYLAAIARNVVLRGFRAREVLFPEGDLDARDERTGPLPGPEPASPLTPEEDLATAEIRALVQTFLAGLSADDRRLIEVRFRDGISQRDAAERLNLTRQRLRSRELGLRKRLIAFLRRHGEAELITSAAVLVSLLATATRPWGTEMAP